MDLLQPVSDEKDAGAYLLLSVSVLVSVSNRTFFPFFPSASYLCLVYLIDFSISEDWSFASLVGSA